MSLLLDALKRAEQSNQQHNEDQESPLIDTSGVATGKKIKETGDSLPIDIGNATSTVRDDCPENEVDKPLIKKVEDCLIRDVEDSLIRDVEDSPSTKVEDSPSKNVEDSTSKKVEDSLPNSIDSSVSDQVSIPDSGKVSGSLPEIDFDSLQDVVPDVSRNPIAEIDSNVLPKMSFIAEKPSIVPSDDHNSLSLEQREPAVANEVFSEKTVKNYSASDHETTPKSTQNNPTVHKLENIFETQQSTPYRPKSKKTNLAFIVSSVVVLVILGIGGTLYVIDTLDKISADSNLSRFTQITEITEQAFSDSRVIENIPNSLISDSIVATHPEKQGIAPTPTTVKKKNVLSEKSNIKTRNPKSATANSQKTTERKLALSIVRKKRVDPLQQLLQHAYDAYMHANYDKANLLYKQVLQQKKNNRDALIGLAIIAHRRDQPTQARRYYKKILSLNPKDSQAAAGLIALVQGSNATESESRIKILLDNEPQAAHLHYTLGNQYVSQARWADAQKAFFQAYSADPSNADYAMNLAVSLDHIKQAKSALQYYRLALELARGKNVSFNVLDVATRIRTINKELPE